MTANFSAYGNVLRSTVLSGSGSAINWNPGVYPRPIVKGTNPNLWQHSLDDASTLAANLAFIDTLANQGFKGVCLGYNLRGLEPTMAASNADYNGTPIDTILTRLRGYNMRLCLDIIINSQYIYNTLPDYMLNAYSTYVRGLDGSGTENTYDATVAYWRSASYARLVAAAQYIGATFGNRPNLERVGYIGETALQIYHDPTYTNANALAGVTQIWQAHRSAAPKIMGFQYFNDVPNPDTIANMDTWLNVAQANQVQVGEVNCTIDHVSVFDAAYRGFNDNGQLPPTSTNTNYRGAMCYSADSDANDYYAVSSHGWIDSGGNPRTDGAPRQTLQQMYDAQITGYSCPNVFSGWATPTFIPTALPSHYCPFVNTGFGGDASNQWPSSTSGSGVQKQFWVAKAQVLPAVSSPTSFTGGVTTGG